MKVKVNQQGTKIVAVNTQGTNEVIAVGVQGPSGVTEISQANDTDVTNLEDGSVLVYAMDTGKWTATTLLEKQTTECGQY
jgi:hypothetical protein